MNDTTFNPYSIKEKVVFCIQTYTFRLQPKYMVKQPVQSFRANVSISICTQGQLQTPSRSRDN